MGLQARSLATANKETTMVTLRRHEQELQELKKQLKQAQSQYTVTHTH